jgi:hypothetical protein
LYLLAPSLPLPLHQTRRNTRSLYHIKAEHEAEAKEEVEDLGPESFTWKSEGIEIKSIEETESDERAVRA